MEHHNAGVIAAVHEVLCNGESQPNMHAYTEHGLKNMSGSIRKAGEAEK